MKRFIVFAAIAFMVLAAGCGGGDGTVGTVEGYVKAPNGTDAIVGAKVTVQGTSLTATSDATGGYRIQGVPSGNQIIIAVKGAFRSQVTVSVTGGGTTGAPDASLTPLGKIGVVPGTYDNIGAVLDGLGIQYVDLQGVHINDVFTTPTKLAEYSVIFFACGGDDYLDPESDAAIITNIRNYVDNGGRLYMSDWAIEMVEQLFPQHLTLLGQSGVGSQTVTASITNPDLSALLGKSQCSIFYDLDAWIVIDSVASGVSTDLSGSVQYTNYDTGDTVTATKPLLVHFAYGDGGVILTTFHNEANVTADSLAILKQLMFGF